MREASRQPLTKTSNSCCIWWAITSLGLVLNPITVCITSSAAHPPDLTRERVIGPMRSGCQRTSRNVPITTSTGGKCFSQNGRSSDSRNAISSRCWNSSGIGGSGSGLSPLSGPIGSHKPSRKQKTMTLPVVVRSVRPSLGLSWSPLSHPIPLRTTLTPSARVTVSTGPHPGECSTPWLMAAEVITSRI